ncbi:3',5'-cyclic-AMP phosphodiesterase [Zophobihabitans entericus]|uniref:3',5'-cyclic-AMP phosphodiesterase n=1 Tax=Zophobihabitans entericus TaxID=1635327 RepID=UPI001AAF2993
MHITDTHLFACENETLLGVNTLDSFNAVICEIEKKKQYYDLIVASGDFVQDGSKAAYERFATRITQLDIPCVWLPGNHDMLPNLQPVFNEYQIPNEKLILLGENWLIILLNSQVPGKAYGRLAESELSFLSETLQQYSERNTCVFLHHHPVLSGCQWLDQHCLQNTESLQNILKQHPQVKTVGFGHIHQNIEQQWEGRMVFATPSTCAQFKPQCNEFTVDECGPGWRDLSLYEDGTIETQVSHIESTLFIPDLTINGY